MCAAGVSAPGCVRRPIGNTSSVLRVGVGVPEARARTSGLTALVDLLTTEPLLTNGLDGRQAERLAVSWTWDGSRTLLRMKLRSDVFFHDGTRLTPQIVAQFLNKSVARHDALSFASIRSITAPGPDTVDIRLSQPDAFLLPDLSLTSIRLPGHGEIGTGPFRLAQRTGSQILLQAFRRYYRGQPPLAGVQIDAFPTQRKAWAAMMGSNLDMLYEVSRDAVEFMEGETAVRVYTSPRTYYIPFVFNVRHPVLRRADVRIALNEAIDKNALVRDGLRGHGQPADGPFWPEHWAYSASPHPFAFNPSEARLRLDHADLPVKPRGDAMPSRFSFTCLVWAEDSRFERLALVLQKQLADIGVDMRLVPLSAADFAERAATGNFDALLIEMAGRSLTWVYMFWHSPGDVRLLDSGYHSGDAILDRIRRSGSDDEIRSGVADLARVFSEDPPAAFLAWQTTSRAVSTKFEVETEPHHDILANAWLWRPVTALQMER
jgi:ABC-type transport system substrate-binding protein